MTGSVYRRGDAWYIRWSVPPGPDGKRRQKTMSCRGLCKREAEIRLHRILDEIERSNTEDNGG